MYRAARMLFGGGVAGKALGMVRELTLAGLFGTRPEVDAFRAGMTGIFIPSHFISTDSLNAGFVPLYARYRQQNQAKAHALFWIVTALIGGLSAAVALGLFIKAEAWVRMLVPGFGLETLEATIRFTRVMAIGMPFYVQGAIFSYLELANAGFRLASARATIQNVGILAGILVAFALRKPICLAWGFTAAQILFFLLGWAVAWRAGWMRWPDKAELPESSAVLREFWRAVLPVLPLPVIVQGNFAVERVVASWLGPGTVASLEYARSITETGLVLIAWPIGLAGLAELSRVSADEAKARLARILPPLLLALLPISAFLAVNGEAVIRALYARGEFKDESVRLTTAVFVGLAATFWAQVAGYVLLRALNAQMHNKQAAAFMAIGFACNIAVVLAAHSWIGPGVLGIGAGVGAAVTFALCAWFIGIARSMAGFTLTLACCLALYVPLALAIGGGRPIRLLPAAALFVAYWGVCIACLGPLRQAARDLLAWRNAA